MMELETINEEGWLKTFQIIKEFHDNAYKAIDKAIKLEESEKPLEAIDMYKEGIELIDNAMKVNITPPEETVDTWDQACTMIKKMKQMRGEILTRINTLMSSHDIASKSSKPSTSESTNAMTYADLAKALNDLDTRTLQVSSAHVIYLNDDVDIYYVINDGTVTSPAEKQKLEIIETDGDVPNKFLQIGEWVYPLVPGVSPCFRSEDNTFMFPDIHSDRKLGIVFSEEEAEVFCDLLTNILHGVVIQHGEITKQIPLDEKISSRIVESAKFLAERLVNTSVYVSNYLDTTVPRHIPSEKPASSKPVPCYIRNGARVTQVATSTTANVIGFVADKIGLATYKLGQYLAPHIQTQGTKLLQSTLNYSEQEASEKVKNVLTIAGGAVEGFSTIYNSLEVAGGILGNSIRNNTVKVVESKYGSPAGEVTRDTLDTVGNVIVINHLRHRITPKGIAKQTAKDTGKAVIR